jgi:hypothetical protein
MPICREMLVALLTRGRSTRAQRDVVGVLHDHLVSRWTACSALGEIVRPSFIFTMLRVEIMRMG